MVDEPQTPDPQGEHNASGRVVKGVKRAFFSATPPANPTPVLEPVAPPPVVAPVAPPVSPATAPVSSPPASPQPVVQTPAPVVQAAPTQSGKPAPPPKKGGVLLWSLFGLLLAGLSAFSVQMYLQYQETVRKLEVVAPQTIKDIDPKKVVEMVRKHMLLPDEEPQINTVTEAERFRVEPFYVNAQNGDKVLVFSRRAILYRPSTDKIIEIGFVRPTSPTPVAEAPKDASSSGESVAGASTQQPKVLYEAAPKSGNQ